MILNLYMNIIKHQDVLSKIKFFLLFDTIPKFFLFFQEKIS